MTDHDPLRREQRELLAAEYALGILTGAELAEAEALARSEVDFSRRAGRWMGRLAPLLDEVREAPPPPRLWERIAARIADEADASPASVTRLKRRAGLWRAWAGMATALAASLALILVTRPPATPPAGAPETPMVAAMAAEDSATRLVATWSPARRSLVVAPSEGPAAPAGHGHQLWLIPRDGRPRPVGMMPQGGVMRIVLAPAMASQVGEGATLAVSVEPEDGSPTGLPTGPVIAAGRLVRS